MAALLHLMMVEWEEATLRRLARHFGAPPSLLGESLDRGRVRAFLLLHLERVSIGDVSELGADAAYLPGLLRDVRTKRARDRIVRAWSRGAVGDAAFARAALEQLRSDIHGHPQLKEQFRSILVPESLKSEERGSDRGRRLRDVLEDVFGDDLKGNVEFKAARDLDRAHMEQVLAESARARAVAQQEIERVTAEAEAAATQRAEKIAEVDSLAGEERLQLMLEGRTGIGEPYPAHWGRLTREELQRMPERPLDAARLRLKGGRRGGWRGQLRAAIHAFDASGREVERDAIAGAIDGLSLEEQLRVLLTSPVEIWKFPASLADRARTSLDALTPEMRLLLVRRVAGHRRGPWRALFRALRDFGDDVGGSPEISESVPNDT